MWYLYHHRALPIYRSLEIPHPQTPHRLSHAGPQIVSTSPYGSMTLRLNEVTRLRLIAVLCLDAVSHNRTVQDSCVHPVNLLSCLTEPNNSAL